jgi:hypothetical protein
MVLGSIQTANKQKNRKGIRVPASQLRRGPTDLASVGHSQGGNDEPSSKVSSQRACARERTIVFKFSPSAAWSVVARERLGLPGV